MRKRAIKQSKINIWYFIITNEKGKEEFVSYKDSREITQNEAFEELKIKYPDCRIATKED